MGLNCNIRSCIVSFLTFWLIFSPVIFADPKDDRAGDWTPVWEGRSRDDYLNPDLNIDMEIEGPEEKALSMVPSLVGARLLDRVAFSFGRYGTDYLQHMIRQYANRGWKLSELREGVLARTGGRPAEIAIQSSAAERTKANETLKTCGLDFIVFVADESRPAHDVTAPLSTHAQSYKRWKRIRKFLNAAFAFGAAVTGGLIETSNQREAFSLLGSEGPAFGAQMRPYIGLGIAGGATEYVFASKSDWFNRNFWSSRDKPWVPAVSLKSLMSGLGRILWPRGFYASAVVNTAIPIVFVQIADFLAALPSSPVAYKAPSPLELAIGIALFTFSLGAAQIGLSKLNSEGGTSEYYRFIYETVFGWINNVGRGISLIPGLGFAGLLVMGAFGVGVTIPLWFKLAVGDRAYNQHTAALLDPENKSVGTFKRSCSWAVGALANLLDFRRVRIPERSLP